MSGEITVCRNGIPYCTCKDESCLYPHEIMKQMKECGYKFYMDGKIYKPETKTKK